MKNLIWLWLCLFVLIFVSSATADITFTDGKWESTFACDEYTGTESWNCNGIDSPYPQYKIDGHSEEVVTAANNPIGGGGRGLRHWIGDGQAKNTCGVNIKWPGALKDLWLRMYFRYPDGFTWDTISSHKWLYFQTPLGNDAVVEPFGSLSGLRLYAYGTPATSPSTYAFGFQDIMGKTTGDGVYHCVEVQLHMDTDRTDGIGRVWVDGDLILEGTGIDFSGGDVTKQLGWTYVSVPSNQAWPLNGQGVPFDVDDIVIYNTTPPNTDAAGNPFIGPIGYSTPSIQGCSISGTTLN